ncbi:PQQ-dependent dehydrogenase, methanol/ethanol family [Bradyrhizobium japonicum]|uniref:PQQ-dependent dehydrogenase, methanol/ethanol family n=1 Tax=Bradyrhizobium japonicum TaxID=375 RepID=UPI0011DDDABC|nr:PQQ-dependent dehydrogenase, methanol/ethanol family [Bradyrhizobium japonicum]MCD9110797.1 PQQ-dependent dehydrogenase, methanol/ethanol family [Bradyrhizobium japonicum]MCD9258732.1 PQQ-dependent dehydrogenase, methanol/ethanol family [Bradyrhizobium japonicum SEMIA 5079]MCD9822331.1 PQQ-dependent dehydrogenase, methanol/ethanol family [Bradyrhizobium japonicum]MCD9894351.1 PQQ-dependent dehydrogenase, methanol/ethanol family [Bradyrhizobium japonicum]MCD9910220.1 PQQ-dependent dehydrogen
MGLSLPSSAWAQSGTDAKPDRIKATISRVDSDFIEANTKTSRNWPTVGLDYAETRFSKLNQINTDNVRDLGLVWSYNLESSRGIEATPLVVDGIMYQSAPWNVVHAIDARTGTKIWSFDPGVDRSKTYRGCCDAVSRGLALYKGKVFVAAYDGRLIALDATTGAKLWETDTLIDHAHSYTITGAPRVFNGKVVIGQSGAEYGVRGYVTAYDSETGHQLWRWFTVPGDPSKPFEDASMEAAAKTWDPSGKYWINGGGGAPWDSITFDPDLNMVYVGTGNGGPWNRKLRSPSGGDNLYLGSIVALDADTGRYIWHYQETPGDNWDYTSTQPMILADIKIDGAPRKVILHAPKNGFFFVIDRTNGKFISAKNFVDVNWATGYDANGRPIELPAARDADQYESIPGPDGAHNWQPMSFNPLTGLVYLPAQHIPVNLSPEKSFVQNAAAPGKLGGLLGGNIGFVFNPPKSAPFGRLLAWDPVHQKEVWRVEHVSPWNGGTLTTAGNLVFQGTADGRFVAYDAANGTKLWEMPTGTGAVAAAATYMVDDRQYISIAVGWGGSYGLTHRATEYQNPGTIYTYALGGTAKLPAFVKYQTDGLLQGVKYDPKDIREGGEIYVAAACVACHGVPGVGRGGNIINLGYVGAEEITSLRHILFHGPFRDQGMPDFSGKLTEGDVVKLQAFIQGTVDAIRPKSR